MPRGLVRWLAKTNPEALWLARTVFDLECLCAYIYTLALSVLYPAC